MPIYAVSTWLIGRVSRPDSIRILNECGFTRVELSADYAALVIDWESDPESLCATLAEAGISVPSVHTPEPGRFLDVPDEAQRLASVEENLRYFRLMRASGVPDIIIHPISGYAGSDDEAWAKVPAQATESLKALAEEAGEMGVRMAVENLGGGGRPGSTMASVLEMIDGLGDHVGLCMDIGHSQQAHLDLLEELSVALSSGKLFTLHLHDVDPEGKDHYIPGEGCIDFDPYLGLLERSGYSGGRTLEIAVAPAETAEERVRQTAALRRQWEARG